MSDHYFDNENFGGSENIGETENIRDNYADDTARTEEVAVESSYEWNPERNYADGEYHYSYINGNNRDASHNPNNYDDAFSTDMSNNGSYYDNAYGTQQDANPYEDYSQPEAQTGSQWSQQYGAQGAQAATAPKAAKAGRSPKAASKGFVAAMLAVALLGSTALGFGGGFVASKLSNSGSEQTSATQDVFSKATDGKNVSTTKPAVSTSGSGATTTSDIVKQTANSVVEIATEATKSGGFSQQYVTKGAGSGVIISEDGYIITNHHVIDDASKITVTLRDGTTTYDAKLIGSDEDNDIALLKVDATGLQAATFGNSSNLVVGDYVIAIGNPLGTLGGTVTDGIISALAREVTIENKNLTLLQTNAQISPGNSGGGLFNANGELVGIVNAKDSATEVEGIAFAIPINNVVNIIKDLKDYGYVTGKIDTGMQFVDISSYDTAFYYNVNQLGVYVLSVDKGSNAESAGFLSGDLITAVNGAEVSTESDISKALDKSKVGDTVTFTVLRSGRTQDIELELTEYVPSAKPNTQEDNGDDYNSIDSLWKHLLDW